MPICASATPSHTLSLVHVTHVKEKIGHRTDFHRYLPFISHEFMYPTLDGWIINTTAQRFCLHHRAFPVIVENLVCLT